MSYFSVEVAWSNVRMCLLYVMGKCGTSTTPSYGFSGTDRSDDKAVQSPSYQVQYCERLYAG